MKTTVVIRDFILECLIGILEHEYKNPQIIKISVFITLQNTTAINAIGDTICYAQVQDFIRQTTQKHFPLVEQLANTILANYMNYDMVQECAVEILKLQVAPNTNGVGVIVSDSKIITS